MFRIKETLKNEKGSALLVALGTMLILTVLSIGMVTVAQNDMGLSGKEKKSTQALHVAEAGIDKALWQLRTTTTINPADFEVTTSLGTATVNASPSTTEAYKWTITSSGEVDDGTKRVVKVDVFNISYWNMIIAEESLTASGGGMHGTSSVHGAFYVRGDMELTGTSEITGGPLFVKDGELHLTSSGASVGTPSEPIILYLEEGYSGHTSNVYYSALFYNTPNINFPTLDLVGVQDLLVEAKSQSVDNRKGYTDITADESASYTRKYPAVSSGHYKVVDSNNSVSTPLGSGTTNLTIASSTPSFGDPGTEASPKDDFAWNQSTRTLTVRGTVFVDGDVTINTDIEYEGNGAIVANGDIDINADVLAADTFPTESCLGFVGVNAMYIQTPSPNTSTVPNVEAALFALQKVEIESNMCIKGALLTRNLEFDHPNGHLITVGELPGNLPNAMPGSTQSFCIVSGWHEGKP